MKLASIFQALTLLAFSLAASLPLTADTPPATGLKVTDGQKVAFLGDSITQFGFERPGGYVRLVVAGLGSAGVKIVPVPAGVSGNTSRDMLARLDRSVLSQKPDWMTLSCGVNDVWHGPTGCDLETYKKNITEIVDKVQAAGIKIIILTATPINENENDNNTKLAAYNDFLRGLAKERNYPLVDLNATFWAKLKATPPAPGTNLLTVDGVHMNPEGNILMARGIMEAFGMSKPQMDAYEATWRASDDAAAVTAGLQLNGVAGVPIAAFNNLAATAAAKKVRLVDITNALYFQAICNVGKAHADDPSVDIGQLKPEIDNNFAALVKALPPAPAPEPAPAAPTTPAPAK